MLDVTERYQQSENSSCSSYSSVVQHLAEEGPNSGCRQTRARGIRNQVSTCSRLLFNTRPVWLSLWSDSSDTWDWLIRVWTTERRAAGRLSLTRSPVKAAGHVHRTDASQWRLTDCLSFHHVCCRTASRLDQVVTRTALKTAETDVDFRQTPAPPDPSWLSLKFWLNKCH